MPLVALDMEFGPLITTTLVVCHLLVDFTSRLGAGVDYSLGSVAIFAEAAYAYDGGSISSGSATLNVNYTRLDFSAGVSIPF